MCVNYAAATRFRSMRWWLVAVLVTAMISTALATAPRGEAQPPALVVDVSGGSVRGFESDGIAKFLGIPYADSTAGDNRFAAPRPAPPWSGIRAATSHGPQCPQASPLSNVPALQASSEDCLSIDLYVPPHAAGESLPVMVWFYGGAFVLGSNAQYDSPSRLVREGKVVVAIPNYRVGPFGFLALPELAASANGATGTYGTLDQQAALRWVQDNAAAFGGDPANVTIFGESAGGMSVCTQFASPTARGLFTKAIIESGACARSPLVPPAEQDAYQRSADYAAGLGCGDPDTRLACLRALPADRLLDSPTTRLTSMDVTWTPVRDDVVITQTPEQALASGAARDTPIIVGSNADEGATFLALMDYSRGVVPTAADYETWTHELLGPNTERVLARYPAPVSGAADVIKKNVITDGFFACPALFTAAAARHGGAHVWQYRFNDSPLGPNPVLPGAFHAAEVPYVFSALQGFPIPLPPAAAALSRRIQDSWAHFAYNGTPVTEPLGDWRPWREDAPLTLQFSSDTISTNDSFAAQHNCDLWSAIPQIG